MMMMMMERREDERQSRQALPNGGAIPLLLQERCLSSSLSLSFHEDAEDADGKKKEGEDLGPCHLVKVRALPMLVQETCTTQRQFSDQDDDELHPAPHDLFCVDRHHDNHHDRQIALLGQDVREEALARQKSRRGVEGSEYRYISRRQMLREFDTASGETWCHATMPGL